MSVYLWTQRHLTHQKWIKTFNFWHIWLPNVLRAPTACTFSTSSKSGPNPGVLYILTWKCASRHNGVHFLDISTSKSHPKLRCFDTFYFQMCFAPQRRTLFPHRNIQKWTWCVLYMFTSKILFEVRWEGLGDPLFERTTVKHLQKAIKQRQIFTKCILQNFSWKWTSFILSC